MGILGIGIWCNFVPLYTTVDWELLGGMPFNNRFGGNWEGFNVGQAAGFGPPGVFAIHVSELMLL